MWRAIYTCKIAPQCCYPVEKHTDYHPVSRPEQTPLCTDHAQTMVLVRMEDLRPRVYSRKRTRRRHGGFQAEQLELWGTH